MSANNMYFAKKVGTRWYGWETTAEESAADDYSRELSMSEALQAGTLADLEDKLDEEYGYAEYGLSTQPELAKDRFPIEVVA